MWTSRKDSCEIARNGAGMISSEVQRTLVKSPPELWAELSDPATLARHLGELGEIRITRVDPERTVEWEAAGTSGTVVIKPSGWGTKVKLTVTRESADPADAGEPAERAEIAGPEPQPEPEPANQPEPEPALEAIAETQYEHFEPELPSEPDGDLEEEIVEDLAPARDFAPAEDLALAQDLPPELERSPEREPRSGFFARLFGRLFAEAPIAEEPLAPEVPSPGPIPVGEPVSELPEDIATVEGALAADPWAAWAPSPQASGEPIAQIDPEPQPAALVEPEPAAFVAPEPESSAPSPAEPELDRQTSHERVPAEAPAGQEQPQETQQPEDISAQIRAAEEVAAEEVTAVLTGVLDRLGAAHHRPFSRS